MKEKFIAFVVSLSVLALLWVGPVHAGGPPNPPPPPGLKEVVTRMMVDVSDKRGHLLRNWSTFVNNNYIRWGWKQIGPPFLSAGRYFVIITRTTFTAPMLPAIVVMPDPCKFPQAGLCRQ
jgi:hypothetical protein